MPQPQDLPARATRAAKSMVRKGLALVPGVEKAARAGYFASLNSFTSQHLAYTTWLRDPSRQSEALTAKVDGRPSLTVVLDVAGQTAIDVDRAVARIVAQTYDNWDLVLTSDTPVHGHRPGRTVLVPNSTRAARMSQAVATCESDYVIFVGPDDVLYPDAFASLAAAVSDEDIVYGGDDIASVSTRDGAVSRSDPFFKPAWNPELLHSTPYLGNAAWLRTSSVVAAGVRDLPGAELWDLQLRLTRGGATVAHAPGIVAGRVTTTPLMTERTARTVLTDTLAAEGSPSCTVAPGQVPGTWSVRYPVEGEPLVSIVIPSKNSYDVVRRCVESIYATTAYRSFEVVLVDTGSDDPEVLAWYEETADLHDSFRVVEWPQQPFSYAMSCNAGAAAASGEILVMLNNDTEVLDPFWLEVLVGEAQRPEVGVVGCLLLYPDRLTVQHAGISLGIKTAAGNTLAGLRLDGRLSRMQRLMLWTRRDTSAVTAACIALRRAVYEEVSGFDPEFRITFNDVDLCLRIGDLGYRVVYTPDVRLLHHESKSIAPSRDWTELYAARDLLGSRWGALVADDPHLNRHLARTTTSYRLPLYGR